MRFIICKLATEEFRQTIIKRQCTRYKNEPHSHTHTHARTTQSISYWNCAFVNAHWWKRSFVDMLRMRRLLRTTKCSRIFLIFISMMDWAEWDRGNRSWIVLKSSNIELLLLLLSSNRSKYSFIFPVYLFVCEYLCIMPTGDDINDYLCFVEIILNEKKDTLKWLKWSDNEWIGDDDDVDEKNKENKKKKRNWMLNSRAIESKGKEMKIH